MILKKILKKIIPPESSLRTPYGISLIEEQRVKFMCTLLRDLISKNISGDVIEFGVFRGGSLRKLARTAISTNKTVYGLDTFEGHPYNDEGNTKQKEGLLSNTKFSKVHNLMIKKGLYNVDLIAGIFVNTMPLVAHKEFCFAHVDCDLYQSHKQVLEFVLPRIVKSGIIYFDDYNTPSCLYVNEVVHEFIDEKDLVILPEKQAYYIKK